MSIFIRPILVSFFFLLGFSCVNSASAATNIEGTINEDTILTASSSPYYFTDDVIVASGASLSIDPGVVVKMDEAVTLDILGTLKVNGTELEPVYFTSWRDDEVGGDTNEDGATTTPAVEDWRAINFVEGSVGTFEHAVLRYAGYHDRWTPVMGAIHNDGGKIEIRNSLIEDNGRHCISQLSGDLELYDSIVSDCDYGVVVLDGDSKLERNLIARSTSYNVFSYGTGDFVLIDNQLDGSRYAVGINLEYSRNINHSGNSAYGNEYNGILLHGPVVSEIELMKDDIPYIIFHIGSSWGLLDTIVLARGNLTVESEGVLTINSGAVVKFSDPETHIDIEGEFIVNGTVDEPVYFTSVHDGVDGVLSGGVPNAADWQHIKFSNGSTGTLKNIVTRYGGSRGSGSSRSIIYNTGGELLIENSELSDSYVYGVRHTAGTTTVSNSSFHNIPGQMVLNEASEPLDARNNYWGDSTGPYHPTLNPDGLGGGVSDNIMFEPWLGSSCTESCYSNILFLPGIMSSRLYEGVNRVWEPSDEGDVERLYMDEYGSSLNDISVGEVIDTFDGPSLINIDIYKSFLEDLSDTSSSGLINDYVAYSYDWRHSIPDILSDGKLVEIVKQLAANSKTGKISIVSHSNGGLIAKALTNELGEEASDLIEQIIFVAVPQLGTPKAIGALLHGFESGVPFTYSASLARDFASNAPMSYQLLPLGGYRNNSGYTILEPLVSFEDGSKTQPFIDQYGYAITNGEELNQFLLGSEGRAVPDYNNLDDPTIANSNLLNSAENLLQSIGVSWTPPEGVVIHEIAGVGEDTLSGITYITIKKCVDVDTNSYKCNEFEDVLSYTPNEVLDGDGTVIAPSALAMSTSSDLVHRWWVDLQKYNDDNNNLWLLRLNHKNILEIPELLSFLSNELLTKVSESQLFYLSSSSPNFSKKDRLIFTLHSPLSLSAVDNEGNKVGENEISIPGATYSRYGEVQVLKMPSDLEFTLELSGEATGSFTLDIVEEGSGSFVSTTTFSAIPSSTSTVVTMDFASGNLEDGGSLKVDYDGDGTTDTNYSAILGETVTEPDGGESYSNIDELISLLYAKNKLIESRKVRSQFSYRIRVIEFLNRYSKRGHFKKSLIKIGERILEEINATLVKQANDAEKDKNKKLFPKLWTRFWR